MGMVGNSQNRSPDAAQHGLKDMGAREVGDYAEPLNAPGLANGVYALVLQVDEGLGPMVQQIFKVAVVK